MCADKLLQIDGFPAQLPFRQFPANPVVRHCHLPVGFLLRIEKSLETRFKLAVEFIPKRRPLLESDAVLVEVSGPVQRIRFGLFKFKDLLLQIPRCFGECFTHLRVIAIPFTVAIANRDVLADLLEFFSQRLLIRCNLLRTTGFGLE